MSGKGSTVRQASGRVKRHGEWCLRRKLVALAVTESSPSQMSVGNETRVPPPAIELMAPARKAAPNATAA